MAVWGGGEGWGSRGLGVVHVPALAPLQQLEQAEAGLEEPVMLEDEALEGSKGQVPASVCVLQCGQRCIQAVGLGPERRRL